MWEITYFSNENYNSGDINRDDIFFKKTSQYSVMTCMGKDSKKSGYMYIYKLIHLAVEQKVINIVNQLSPIKINFKK